MTDNKILVLSDIHIPFHDPIKIKQAIQIGKKNKVNQIILNGDIIDFHSISRFEKDPRTRNLTDEIEQTRHFLTNLRKTFPAALITYKQGNHESRWLKYIWTTAEEFADLPELSLESILHFRQFKIKYSPETEVIKVGDLSIIHGQEIKGTLSPYPARTALQAAKTNILFGHCHRQSSFVTRDLNDKVYSAYSTGCLCQLQADYSTHNEWTHGCAIVTENKGRAQVSLISL